MRSKASGSQLSISKGDQLIPELVVGRKSEGKKQVSLVSPGSKSPTLLVAFLHAAHTTATAATTSTTTTTTTTTTAASTTTTVVTIATATTTTATMYCLQFQWQDLSSNDTMSGITGSGNSSHQNIFD